MKPHIPPAPEIPTTPKKLVISERKRARRFALQALYQWQLTQQPPEMILQQFLKQEEMVSVDTDFLCEVITGVVRMQTDIDEKLQALLKDRLIIEVNPVELAILRMGAYELMFRLEIPYKSILNETIELAKTFGAAEGHKYVNGILHHLAHQLRSQEFK